MLMLGYRQFSVLLLAVFSTVECAKILGVFYMPTLSHYGAGNTLLKILAERGHEVTMVAPFSEKNPPKNYKEVVLSGISEEFEKIKKRRNLYKVSMSDPSTPIHLSLITTSIVEKTFNHTEFKKFMMSGEKYDAVIVDDFQADAMKYVAHHFNAPLIVYTIQDSNELVNPYQGNPDSPAYLPSMFLPHLTCEMSFFERLHNSIFYVYGYLVRNLFRTPMQNKVLHKYYPNAPNLNDIIYNVSLVLLNGDLSVHEPLPIVPSMVNVGGFHIKKSKPLPEDLQKLLDNAKNGVIYFSLGSNIQSKNMPKEKRDILLRSLSKLKETVIWKYEDDNLPGKPDNVIIKKWLPQNDIFAHKNVKLFITHGGIFSVMEAVYHGIPFLSLPIFAEQNLNAKRAAIKGYGKYMRFQELKEETFTSYLQEMLKNPQYAENTKIGSKIMADKPIPVTESLNYWVEYVIRHKGAPHMRVAALNLSWYQSSLLDVIAFIVVIFSVFLYAIILLIKFVSRKITERKGKKTFIIKQANS